MQNSDPCIKRETAIAFWDFERISVSSFVYWIEPQTLKLKPKIETSPTLHKTLKAFMELIWAW